MQALESITNLTPPNLLACYICTAPLTITTSFPIPRFNRDCDEVEVWISEKHAVASSTDTGQDLERVEVSHTTTCTCRGQQGECIHNMGPALLYTCKRSAGSLHRMYVCPINFARKNMYLKLSSIKWWFLSRYWNFTC